VVYPELLQKLAFSLALYDVRAAGGGGLSVSYTQRSAKTTAVHASAWRFGHEDFSIFFVKVYVNSMEKD
jgi:hypothetical protein